MAIVLNESRVNEDRIIIDLIDSETIRAAVINQHDIFSINVHTDKKTLIIDGINISRNYFIQQFIAEDPIQINSLSVRLIRQFRLGVSLSDLSDTYTGVASPLYNTYMNSCSDVMNIYAVMAPYNISHYLPLNIPFNVRGINNFYISLLNWTRYDSRANFISALTALDAAMGAAANAGEVVYFESIQILAHLE